MRRIFIPVLSIALLLTFSSGAFAQTCSVSTTAPVGVTFGTTLAVTAAQDFTGTNTTLTGSNLTYDNNTTSSITSPIYFYANSASTLYFRMNLDPANGSQDPVTATITINYGVNGAQSFTCTTTAFTPVQTAADYYFQITPVTPFPNNTNFTATIALATGNREIVAVNFAANAILAPAGAVLPVKFAQFTAKAVSSGVQLNWTIDAEENTKGYEIERSADGRNYAPIAPVYANGARSYSFIDTKPLADGYYRIKATDFDGKFGYSNIVRMKGGVSNVVVKGFLSSSNLLTVQHDMAPAGSRISVTSADGRMIKSVVVVPGAQQTFIDVSAVRTGLMLVRYETSTGVAETIKIVKQ